MQKVSRKNSMLLRLLKFNTKLTLNQTKHSLSFNKAKSALLTVLSRNPFQLFLKEHYVAYFSNKLHSISEMEKNLKYLKCSNIFKRSL